MKIYLHILLLFGGVIIQTSCTRKAYTNLHKEEFTAIIEDLQQPNFDFIRFKRKHFRNYEISSTSHRISDLKTVLEKASQQLKEGEVSEFLVNDDNTCGVVKLRSMKEKDFGRVRIITLKDNNEETADKIIEAYNDGVTFDELLNTHSKLKENDGDTGWVALDTWKIQLQRALRKHQQGQIYKLVDLSKQWQVVLQTHDVEAFPSVELIKVLREDCLGK